MRGSARPDMDASPERLIQAFDNRNTGNGRIRPVVAMWSFAEVAAHLRHVCFTPITRHRQRGRLLPKSAQQATSA
jgi:hypothetical protein